MTAALVDGLVVRFGELHAVAGVSFAVAPGEVFGLLGPNGAGKTTTLRVLTTLLPPTEGRAVVAGYDVRRQSLAVRASIGYVPQALSADAAASLHHTTRLGDATLAYVHTQTTLVGLVGIADTHSVTARLSGELRSGLQLRLEPGLLRTTQTGRGSTVYRVSIGGRQPVGRRLAIQASYDRNLQHGSIYAAQSMETIGHQVIMLTLVAAAPERARR